MKLDELIAALISLSTSDEVGALPVYAVHGASGTAEYVSGRPFVRKYDGTYPDGVDLEPGEEYIDLPIGS